MGILLYICSVEQKIVDFPKLSFGPTTTQDVV